MSMIHPAKKPQPNGFDLATFAPHLDGEAAESLSAFLEHFKGLKPIDPFFGCRGCFPDDHCPAECVARNRHPLD